MAVKLFHRALKFHHQSRQTIYPQVTILHQIQSFSEHIKHASTPTIAHLQMKDNIF